MGEFNREGPQRGRSDRRDSPRRSFGNRNSSRGRFGDRDSSNGGFNNRNSRGGFGGGRFNQRSFGPKEMHKATCAECGQECEVPFKPTEGREVFCKECFRKKRQY